MNRILRGLPAFLLGVVSGCGEAVMEQHIVEPGDIYHVEGHGNLGRKPVPSLVCRYRFSGGERVRVYDYAADAVDRSSARSQCPATLVDVGADIKRRPEG